MVLRMSAVLLLHVTVETPISEAPPLHPHEAVPLIKGAQLPAGATILIPHLTQTPVLTGLLLLHTLLQPGVHRLRVDHRLVVEVQAPAPEVADVQVEAADNRNNRTDLFHTLLILI